MNIISAEDGCGQENYRDFTRVRIHFFRTCAQQSTSLLRECLLMMNVKEEKIDAWVIQTRHVLSSFCKRGSKLYVPVLVTVVPGKQW